MKAHKLGGIGWGVLRGLREAASKKDSSRDRRLAKNSEGKRQCVGVIRERDSGSVPAAFPNKCAARWFVAEKVAKETELMADDATLRNGLDAPLLGHTNQPSTRLLPGRRLH